MKRRAALPWPVCHQCRGPRVWSASRYCTSCRRKQALVPPPESEQLEFSFWAAIADRAAANPVGAAGPQQGVAGSVGITPPATGYHGHSKGSGGFYPEPEGLGIVVRNGHA